MTEFVAKLRELPRSRRFWTAGTAMLVCILSEWLGLSDATAREIAAIMSVWIVGDSLNKTR